MRTFNSLCAIAAVLVISGCGLLSEQEDPDSEKKEAAQPITNRVDIPSAVRRNLGITFAKVEMRRVANTVRVPGVFEAQPFAHRAYHATLPGKAEILVKQYQRVKTGHRLIRLESPDWREMQQSLIQRVVDMRAASHRTKTLANQITAVGTHAKRLQQQRKVWEDRLRQVESLSAKIGGAARQKTEVLSELSKVDTALAKANEERTELEGERTALLSKLAGYREATPILYGEAIGDSMDVGEMMTPKIDVSLERAAALLGLSSTELQENVGTESMPVARWRVIDRIEIIAKQPGVIEKLEVTNGAWVNTGEVMLTTVDNSKIRFRGVGLQADLGRLNDGLPARILAPGNSGGISTQSLAGALALGLESNPLRRTIDLLVTPTGQELPHWARIGVSTQAEIVLAGSDEPELAIPIKSTIKDGLELVIFRRDPKNPDKVIRISADLGIDDGRWVTVKSGLIEGDEVVAGGIYELMLASGGTGKQKGGHFHADGTFHEGADH